MGEKLAEILLETKHGSFSAVLFGVEGSETCLLVYRKPWGERPFIRLHSSCLFGESFAAADCDCGHQLDASLVKLSSEGGVVVYLFQEGRGVGLFRKMLAIHQEQDSGVDTVEAFARIGSGADPRNYEIACMGLESLGVPKTIRLATSNPAKQEALEAFGFQIAERIDLPINATERIHSYRVKKRSSLGHHDGST